MMHPLSIRQFIQALIHSGHIVVGFYLCLVNRTGHIGTRERKQTDRHRQTRTDRHRQRVSGVTRLKETDSDRQRKSEGEWIDKD